MRFMEISRGYSTRGLCLGDGLCCSITTFATIHQVPAIAAKGLLKHHQRDDPSFCLLRQPWQTLVMLNNVLSTYKCVLLLVFYKIKLS